MNLSQRAVGKLVCSFGHTGGIMGRHWRTSSSPHRRVLSVQHGQGTGTAPALICLPGKASGLGWKTLPRSGDSEVLL